MEERQYEMPISWDHVRVTGHRIFMVRPFIKSKLTCPNSICHIDTEQKKVQAIDFKQDRVLNLDYFQYRVGLLEHLKGKQDIIQSRIVYTDVMVQNLIKQIPALEQNTVNNPCSETQISAPYISTGQMTYSDAIHDKVDTILKGTENDPIGRAQFDNFISRISQAYEEASLDIKSPKEK